MKLPLHIGDPSPYDTHNGNTIKDATNENVCMVYGLPTHISLEELRALPRFSEGLATITKIILCVNHFDEMKEVIKFLLSQLCNHELDDMDKKAYEAARTLLAQIESESK